MLVWPAVARKKGVISHPLLSCGLLKSGYFFFFAAFFLGAAFFFAAFFFAFLTAI